MSELFLLACYSIPTATLVLSNINDLPIFSSMLEIDSRLPCFKHGRSCC